MQRALYRSRQFFAALRPRVDPDARAEAMRLLSATERRLFDAMTTRDQQHCLQVYQRLLGQGLADDDLLIAGLLHDAGKGHIALWHRVAYVLLEARAPSLLGRLAAPGDLEAWPAVRGWRQALYRCRHHAALGAELARRAGASDGVVALIEADVAAPRRHLHALEAADDAA